MSSEKLFADLVAAIRAEVTEELIATLGGRRKEPRPLAAKKARRHGAGKTCPAPGCKKPYSNPFQRGFCEDHQKLPEKTKTKYLLAWRKANGVRIRKR